MTATEQDWRCVASQALQYASEHADTIRQLRIAAFAAPRLRHHLLWQPEKRATHIGLSHAATDSDAVYWEKAFEKYAATVAPISQLPEGYGKEPWIWVKQAVDPVASATAQILNFKESPVNAVVGGPSPLAALLASGVVGGGLGYLSGAVAEKVLPEAYFARNALRKRTALLGALFASLPAAAWGYVAQQANPDTPGWRAWLSSWPFSSVAKEEMPLGEAKPTATQPEVLTKESFIPGGLVAGIGSLDNLPPIPKDDFGRVVWEDYRTPMGIRAATTGLVNTAADMADRTLVSPLDIARVANTGVRGLMVGKVLGALAGMRPTAQKELQRQGIWAALLTTVVPQAFPNPAYAFRMI